MTVSAAVVLMTIAAGSSQGQDVSGSSVIDITVCIELGSAKAADLNQIYFAQRETARIFDTVGVKVDWRTKRSCPQGDAIQIGYKQVTSNQLHPGALAFAFPFQEGRVVILYDRVSDLANSNHVGVNHLLTYVLLHEITHVLQGVDTHSATGIMKAHWSYSDSREIQKSTLGFTEHDLDLIRAESTAKHDRLSRVPRTAPTEAESMPTVADFK